MEILKNYATWFALSHFLETFFSSILVPPLRFFSLSTILEVLHILITWCFHLYHSERFLILASFARSDFVSVTPKSPSLGKNV
jgi:hypothetical protein